MARTDDKLRTTVRLQIIDEVTGEPLEYVNVRTNAKSVSFSDGNFLEDVMKSMRTALSNVQVSEARTKQLLEQHLTSNLHADATKLHDAFIGLSCDKNTGVVRFLRYDGTTFEWDTALEHIPLDIDFDKKTNKLKLITDKHPDGLEIDLSTLVDVFEGEVTDDTTTKVTSDNHIIVHLNKKGVSLSHLSEDLQEFVGHLNDFLLKYEEKIKNIEDNANNYTLPPATPEILGGIKTGFGLTADEDGTTHTTNVRIGETEETATSCGIFLEVCSVGGPSTEPIPTMKDATSYITSEGNIIEYIQETAMYKYRHCTTDGHLETNLTKADIAEKFVPGLELVEMSNITWYLCEAEPNTEYAVLSVGDGFVYTLSSIDRLIVTGYIDTATFLERFNNGEFTEGELTIPEVVDPDMPQVGGEVNNNGSN